MSGDAHDNIRVFFKIYNKNSLNQIEQL